MTVDNADVADALGSTDISDFQPFIDPAGRLYDRLVEGEEVPPETRDDVVTRLAAHLVATGPEPQVESGDDVSFRGETGKGLRATTHGQMAIMLDPTGKLATSDKPGGSIEVPDVT